MRTIRLLMLLLICVGLGLAWWRSSTSAMATSFYLHRGWGQFGVISRGAVAVILTDVPAGASWSWDASQRPDEAMESLWQEIVTPNNVQKRGWIKLCGVTCTDSNNKTRLYAAVIPMPIVLGAMLVPLGWSAWSWRKARRGRRLGYCPVCGYDLRHSTGRCPECGTPIATTASTPTA